MPLLSDSGREGTLNKAAAALALAALLYFSWTLAWVLMRVMAVRAQWIGSGAGQFAYWTAMKLLLWVVPASLFLSTTKLWRAEDAFRSGRGRTLSWGMGTGLALGLIALAGRTARGMPAMPALGWGLAGGVLVAPVVEELFFRGAVLRGLEGRVGFWKANMLAAVLFVGAHVPGWYFQGRLAAMLTDPFGGVFSILLLGFVFGIAARGGRSIQAAMIAHMLNNLFNA